MRRTVWTLLVFLVGCAPKQAEQEPPVSRTDITATSRETRYPMDHLGAGSIQLADGAYRDSAAGLSVKLERSAVGDVDGDGRADAAVILASQTGGSGTFVDLYTVLDREAGAVA